jgi:hypothetical protein
MDTDYSYKSNSSKFFGLDCCFDEFSDEGEERGHPRSPRTGVSTTADSNNSTSPERSCDDYNSFESEKLLKNHPSSSDSSKNVKYHTSPSNNMTRSKHRDQPLEKKCINSIEVGERGEKLEKVANQANHLHEQTNEFQHLAKQLKEKHQGMHRKNTFLYNWI